MNEKKRNRNSPIVFFDGVCHLCSGFVDWAIIRDVNKQLLFAPLQGETAQDLLTPEQRSSLHSVLVLDGSQVLDRSDAIFRVLQELPRWRFASIFRMIPRPVRDFIYHLVAHNRYRWFGQRESCRIPTNEEAESLLP